MKTVRAPVDAAALVKKWLKDHPTRDPDLLVALEVPPGWTQGAAPVLVIADDGGALDWPVSTSPTIRVTSWTPGRDRTYVHWALGLLLGSSIPGVAAILPGTGILEARDDKTHADLASFTVRLRIRTT